jgi:uncharacterized membrane protein YraQ (UPF0718 family)
MKNKTLGAWLIGTLIAAIVCYYLNEDLAGLIIVANWVFVIMAGNRLLDDKLNQ